jgi:hypothetical protein
MPPPNGLLVADLLSTPDERQAFRERVARLSQSVLDTEKIHARVEAAVARMLQARESVNPEVIQRQAALLQHRVEERVAHLRAELEGNRPKTPDFNSQGIAQLDGWTPKPDWNHSPLKLATEDGQALLSIQATNGYCFGSWRLALWLPAGRYRFEGVARTTAVMGLPSRTGSGAGVRILGNMRGMGVGGSQDWTPVGHRFTVPEGCEWVELIAELRAYQGLAWFDPTQFRLVRVFH